MEQDSLFEQMANISKAQGYEILAKQVTELKNCNRELIEMLAECASYLPALASHQTEQSKFDTIDKLNINAKSLINKAKILSL